MEKYGKIPPKFTKAWWSYFWEYYKWYVLGTLFVIILVSVWVFQCTHRPQYDMTIVYASHKSISEEQQEKIAEIAAQYVPDADGNGESKVFFQPLIFSDNAGAEEFDYAIQTKLDLTFVDDYTYLYLMDEIEARMYMKRDTIAEMFELPNFALDTELLMGESDGMPHALSLKDSTLLQENGIDHDDLYLMVKVRSKDDEKNIKSHDGAMAFAEALVK